jgi:uncharacterized protein GlcG (DUF336 family)
MTSVTPDSLVVPQDQISEATAQRLVAAAATEAAAQGKQMAIAVVDAGGTLKAFLRMDSAPLLAVDIAIDKAYTAASFGLPTHGWREFLDQDAGIAQIAHRPRLTAFAGGHPVIVDAAVVGGIGVSGGHYSEDRAIAEHALSVLGLLKT